MNEHNCVPKVSYLQKQPTVWIWLISQSFLTPVQENETHGIELSCLSNTSWGHWESAKPQPMPKYVRQPDRHTSSKTTRPPCSLTKQTHEETQAMSAQPCRIMCKTTESWVIVTQNYCDKRLLIQWGKY